MTLKTLVFAPHSDIWVHAFPEALVAGALQDSGQQVVYVGCGRVFENYCICMSARGLTEASSAEQKQAACEGCGRNERMLRREFGFEGYRLADVLTSEDYRQAAQRVGQASPESLLALLEEGIPVGRYALYEYLLNKKKSSLAFSQAEWQEFAIHLRNAYLALFAGKRILEREKPQRVLAYNSLYSVNRVFCALAEAAGARTYFLHAGTNLSNRLQTLMIGRHDTLRYYDALIERWPEWQNVRCDAGTMRRITDHFLVLFRGASLFGYSSRTQGPSTGLRQRYGIEPQQRVLVAVMSSYDEQFAAVAAGARPAPDALFPRQADWIASLLDFIRQRKDLFLLVRVHPREFPNRRERVKSEHAALLEALLKDLPPNARVNWPDDEVSLYDLAGEASVFLNAWSSAGKEMTALGLPAVTYCPQLLLYPAALHEAATTLPGYYAAIERALASGWSVERMRLAYRWLAVEYRHGLFDIADGFRHRELGLAERIWRRAARLVHPGLAQWVDCLRRPQRLGEADAIARLIETEGRTRLDVPRDRPAVVSEAEETAALKRELQRMRAALFGTARCGSPQSLCARFDEALAGDPQA